MSLFFLIANCFSLASKRVLAAVSMAVAAFNNSDSNKILINEIQILKFIYEDDSLPASLSSSSVSWNNLRASSDPGRTFAASTISPISLTTSSFASPVALAVSGVYRLLKIQQK